MMRQDDPLNLLLDRLPNAKKSGDGYQSCCPAHRDTKPSLDFRQTADGTVVLRCFAGCTAAAVCEALGIKLADLFPPKTGGNSRPERRPPPKTTPSKGYATLDDVIEALLATKACRDGHVTRHVYSDTFVVLRFDFDTGKTFRPVFRDDAGWHCGDPPGALPLYHVEDVSSNGTVYVVEGEKCADIAKSIGLTAVTWPHGANAVAKVDWSPLAGKRCPLLPDANDPGRKGMRLVAKSLASLSPPATVLIVELPGLHDGEDLEQFVDAQGDSVDVAGLIDELANKAKPIPRPGPDLVCVAAVSIEPVKWEWQDRIARGKQSLMVGPPGMGKTFVSHDITARISAGKRWPDHPEGPRIPPGDVIILSAEDAIADTIAPRLKHCGANLQRVHVLRGIRQPEDPDTLQMFSLQRDLRHLRNAIAGPENVRLVILDPMSAYLGGKGCDSYKDAEVRAVLAPVAELAEESGVAVLGIMHTRKTATDPGAVVYRILGSVAFSAASRAVHFVTKDPGDLDGPRRLFLQGKNNLAPDPGGLAFTIERPGYVQWGPGRVDITAEQALNPPRPKARTARDNATDWLRTLLKDGPLGSEEIYRQGDAAGHAKRTLKRAKTELGIEARPVPVVREGKQTKEWRWFLPDKGL